MKTGLDGQVSLVCMNVEVIVEKRRKGREERRQTGTDRRTREKGLEDCISTNIHIHIHIALRRQKRQ